MMIKHHPDTQLLTDFAAGSLAFGQALCVSVHLESCTDCRRRVRALDGIGGELLQRLEPATVDDDLFGQLLARIDSETASAEHPAVPVRAGQAHDLPRALAKLLPGGLKDVAWQRATTALHTAVLPVGDDSTQVSLVRMKPGGSIGTHRHAGKELTVVLAGGVSDRGGVYRAGDLVALSKDETHRPIAHQNEDCICLTAQDAPIRFLGVKGLLLNRFIGFHPA